jgi:hypothetical protein
MNLTTTELGHKLYEVSGWEPPFFTMVGDKFTNTQYDLGFLLRKLPRKVEYYQELTLMIEADPFDTRWGAQYVNADYEIGQQGQGLFGFAQTPEDAAAQLAIELFEKGVLEK